MTEKRCIVCEMPGGGVECQVKLSEHSHTSQVFFG